MRKVFIFETFYFFCIAIMSKLVPLVLKLTDNSYWACWLLLITCFAFMWFISYKLLWSFLGENEKKRNSGNTPKISNEKT